MLDLKILPFAAIGAVPVPEDGRAVLFLSTLSASDQRMALYARTAAGVVLLWSES